MRIVSGEFKGRVLEGPGRAATRPTSDKVREALFSILGDVSGARVLDLFAGTGALALEALSRGAAHAVLVERERRMAAIADRNVIALLGSGSQRVELVRDDAIRYLRRSESDRFDLVLIDPPYASTAELMPELLDLLAQPLAAGARIVIEADRRSELDLAASGLSLSSQHRYGDTLLSVLQTP